MSKPLAVQLYTFREALASDRAAALRRVAAAGFGAVEPFGVGNSSLDDVRELRRLLDENGLTVVATHGGWSTDESFDGVLDQLEVLGTDRLIAPAPGTVRGHGDAMKSVDGVRKLAEALNWSAERAAARGVRIGYHNHEFEWAELENGQPAYDVFVAELDPKVFLEIDIYWAHSAGQNPAEVVARYADRVELLHAKDGPGGRVLQTAIGEGVVDNPGAIAAGAKVDHAIVELDDCEGDPYDAARAGAEWLVSRGHAVWSVDGSSAGS